MSIKGGRFRARAILFTVLATLVAVFTITTPANAAVTVPFNPVPIGAWHVNGDTETVLIVGNVVFVGGAFNEAIAPNGTSVTRNNLAAFNLATGALITGFQANTNNTVRALASDGSSLWFGGDFTQVNGTGRAHLARVDVTTGALSGANPGPNGLIYALDLAGGRLLVGGTFSAIGGQSKNRVAAVNPTSGAVDSTFSPQPDNTVHSLRQSPDGSVVYIAGDLTHIAGASRPGMGAVDGVTGALRSTVFASAVATTDALEINPSGTVLFAAIGGTGNAISAYNTSTGARMWTHKGDGDGQAVAYANGIVYWGFHEGYQGDDSVRLLAMDATNGAFDTSFQPTFNEYWGVRGISATTNGLAIAGVFTNVNGTPAEGVAIFAPTSSPPPPPPPPTGYAATVLADHPTLYWRLDDPSGTTVADSTSNDHAGTYRSGVVYGVASALAGDSDPAVSGPGSSGVAYSADEFTGPTTYSLETWFRSTSTSGGKLLGFENVQTGWGTSYDRQVYMTNAGHLAYGIDAGGVQHVVAPTTAYNDGAWHYVVATQGASGMALYVDGVLVGTDPTVTPDGYSGFWRLGGGNVTGWPGASTSSAVAGSFDETAVYPVALTAAQVTAHYQAGT
jgi:Concanavalin A-like lectin/glucanases superfamily/PQQ-like domain